MNEPQKKPTTFAGIFPNFGDGLKQVIAEGKVKALMQATGCTKDEAEKMLADAEKDLAGVKVTMGPKPGSEDASDESFGAFMASLTGNLNKVELLKSSKSSNTYPLIGSKGDSHIGVSVMVGIVPHENKPVAGLILRFLERPAANGASVFAEPGETRKYLDATGKPVEVYMMRRVVLPLCPAQVSAYEMQLRLKEVYPEVIHLIVETFKASGITLFKEVGEEGALHALLFDRFSHLPTEPARLFDFDGVSKLAKPL